MSFTANLDEVVAENRNHLLGKHPNWSRVRLKEVANILNGFPFESSRFNKDSGIPLIRIRDILSGATETYYNGTFDPAFMIHRGDILVGMDGDFHCQRWGGEPALLNQRVCRITPDESRYSKQFLQYVLPGYLRAINEQTPSVTVKHLSSRTIADIPLPLPPLPEQLRIAAELEKQFTRLEAGVAALRRVHANLKRYRAAVLKAACEGQLVSTEAEVAKIGSRKGTFETGDVLLARILSERRRNWHGRGQYKEPASAVTDNLPAFPAGWGIASLEQLTSAVRPICYGILMPKENVANGVLVVKVRDMKGDKIDLESLHRTAPEIAAKYARATLRTGDLLLSIRGTYGRVAEVPKELDGGNITQDTARLEVTGLVDHRYVATYLRNPDCQNYFKRVARGVAVKGVNIGDVRLTPIPLPPLAEQARIVTEVERRLSVVDELETAVTANLQRATGLRQSILRKAFMGQL